MKILIVNTVCKTGSTGKIAYGLHRRLKTAGHESLVCYGRGAVCPLEKDLIRIASSSEVCVHAALARWTGYAGCYSSQATTRLLRIMDEFRPDVVQLFNLHGYYLNEFRVLDYLKTKKIKTVYSMLDEYPYMGKCCYPFGCERFKTGCGSCPQVRSYPKSLFFDRSAEIFRLKKSAYDGFDNIVFTAPLWAVERAQNSALLQSKRFEIIDEFVDLGKTFYPRDARGLRAWLEIPAESRIALTVAPFSDPRKGGIHFLRLAQSLKTEALVFVHVGYDGPRRNLPGNFRPVGFVADQNALAAYYSLADIFVCTSLADTMPNVCLESLACGTPLCGFDSAGIPDVATPEFGIFTPSGDVPALTDAVKSIPRKTTERIAACRHYAEKRYSGELFLKKILQLYASLK